MQIDKKFKDMMADSNKRFEAIIDRYDKKYDGTLGALGARWGLNTEKSFRKALKGILETSFDIKVLNISDYDDEGDVFGHPDQIEIDVIIQDGLLIVCEIKSSMSKSDMYTFEKKARFYEKRHDKTVDRMIVISPMVAPNAYKVAEDLGIELYSSALSMPEDAFDS
ncbi:MAG: hypothetical protein MAG431_02360 [Chloroflexi bacterium]|nr:hypothetical protein [Chloroflexota bacterium]